MSAPTRDHLPAGHPTADPSADGQTGDLTGGTTDAPVAGGGTSGTVPVVPGYDLLDEVGRGGMGIVYRARDVAFGRDVAVKLLPDRFPADGHAARRFADEARITGQLQHPGIPAAYQTGTLPDGRPFLAMKLIKGDTLDALVRTDRVRGPRASGPHPERAGGPRSTEGVPDAPRSLNLVAAFEKVCEAVGYAHARGVIHRDLKPANVMVGGFGEVQVMDWGLAKVLASRGRDRPEPPEDPDRTALLVPHSEIRVPPSDETQAGSLLGTLAYMPPEQAMGAVDEIDARSDVFGLGAVLCAILTGEPPYVGDTAESVRRRAVRADLDDARSRLAGCGADPGLVALCERCLSPKPADRPADAGAVAAEVARLRADADERARRAELDRATAEAEAREQRKRRRAQLALGSAALLTLLAGGGLAGWQWRRADRALGEVTAEQGKTAAALGAVTAEEAKTRQALADKTAESAAKDDARRKTLATLRRLTDELVGERVGRQAAVTDRDRQFFRDVLGLWAEYAAGSGDGPAADALRAEGAYRVGRLRHDLGEWREAEASYRAALAIYERLAAADPAAAGHRRGAAKTLTDLGVLLSRTGRPADAERALRAAAAAAERLAAARPAEPDDQDLLASLLINLGAELADTRRPAEAERAHQAARAVYEGLVAAHPAVPGYQSRLASVQNNLGVLLRKAGRPADAEPAFRAAVATAGRLAAARPDAPDGQEHLARYHLNLAAVLADTGRPADAEAATREGLAGYERLAAAYPVVAEYRAGLAEAHYGLGVGLAEAGRAADAARAYRRAIDLLPKFPAPRINLGMLLSTQGDFAGAVAVYREAADALPDNSLIRTNRRRVERAAALAGRLPAVKAGADRPADAAEAVALAEHAIRPFLKEYALAFRLYADAFAADPRLAEAVNSHRYNAACAAVRAAAGDDPSALVGWDEWGILQDRAFGWLAADLAAVRKLAAAAKPADRTEAAAVLAHWQQDADLASVRDPARRAWMPPADRDRWAKFWAEVEAARGSARPAANGPGPPPAK